MPWQEIFAIAVVLMALISVPMPVPCPLLMQRAILTVRPHSLVNKVIYDEQKQKATGVEIIDTETKQDGRILCKNYFPECIYGSHCIYFIEFNFITFSQWTWVMEATR